MQPITEELEFDEAELFADNDQQQEQDAAHSDNEASSTFDIEVEGSTNTRGLQDLSGHDLENSAKSSTHCASLAQETEEADARSTEQPAGMPQRRHGMAMSLPVHSNIRMGTSVPISIPSLNRWKLRTDGSDAAQQGVPGEDSQQAGVAPQPVPYYPATFVPPHQLSQREDFMFSFTGESPGVALKRSKLRTRNAILKSTGFLEPEARTVASIGAQERQRVMLSLTGGLSQALQGAAVL